MSADTIGRALASIFFLAGCGWGLSGCYEPEEGCLDLRAANYNVEADRPCPECCEYPEFRVSLEHRVEEDGELVNLLLDSLAYTDAAGRRFGLLSVKFYLSKLRLLRDDGHIIRSFDTIGLRFPQAPGDTLIVPVEDNFALSDPTSFATRVMGPFRGDGQIEGIEVLLGLQDTSNAANPAFLPSEHPLADKEMYLGGDEGHIFTRLELFSLTNQTDTSRTVLNISGASNLRELSFPASFYLDPGFSPDMLVVVDYGTWFPVIDLEGKTVAEMERDLLEVMPGSLILASVTTSLN